MQHSPPRRLALASRLTGLMAALIALATQLALGAMLPVGASASRALDALATVAVICHPQHAPVPGGKPKPAPQPDRALCPLMQAIAQSGAVLRPSAIALPPPAEMAWRPAPPAPSAPPHIARLAAAYPRGPPG